MAALGRIIVVVNLLALFAFLNPDEPLRYGVIAIVTALTACGLLLADVLNQVERPKVVVVGVTAKDCPAVLNVSMQCPSDPAEKRSADDA